MDNHERRTRQSNAPGYVGSSHNSRSQHSHSHSHSHSQHHPQHSASSVSTANAGSARQSQLPLQASAGRSLGGAANMSAGYPPTPAHGYSATPGAGTGYHTDLPSASSLQSGATMQSGSLQYSAGATDFSQDSTQRSSQAQAPQQSTQQPAPSQQSQASQQTAAGAQQQTPGQSQYHSMYPFQQQQATPPSPYDPVQPYPPRQPAPIDVLSNQFGVPQGYYVPGEGGPTSAPNATMTPQGVQPQYNTMSYTTTQSPVGRDSLTSAYATSMTDPAQQSSNQQTTGYGQPGYTADLDNAYGSYQSELRRTFENIRDCHLYDAGNSLTRISDWLLTNADNLGLVRDDESMHGERLKLWSEFNTCWLSLLQTQKDIMLKIQSTGQRPQPPQSLLDHEQMENMGKELVRLCDIMEKHGLVDYQMGVWEEDIISLLTQCLDLVEDQGGASASASVSQQPASRRR